MSRNQKKLQAELDGYQFSQTDANYLLNSIPHVEYFFMDLIEQGYFNKFDHGSWESPQLVNILELGCNVAPLAFSLESLQTILRKKNIFVQFKYLGIDVIKSLMEEMNSKFFSHGHDNVFFSGLPAQNRTAVRKAMDDASMESVDIVLIRRPIVIGMEWNQWIYPAMTVQSIIISLSQLIPNIRHRPFSIIYDFAAPHALSSTILNNHYQIMGTQYAAFQQILSGEAALNYEGAMVIATNYWWLEHMATFRTLSRSYNGSIYRGAIPAYSPGTSGLLMPLEHYYSVIQDYHHNPSNPWSFPENYLDNKLLGGIIFLYATKKILRGQSVVEALFKFVCLSFALMWVAPLLQIDNSGLLLGLLLLTYAILSGLKQKPDGVRTPASVGRAAHDEKERKVMPSNLTSSLQQTTFAKKPTQDLTKRNQATTHINYNR